MRFPSALHGSGAAAAALGGIAPGRALWHPGPGAVLHGRW